MDAALISSMSFGQAVDTYKQYVRQCRNNGQKPVSFMHFLTGLR